MGTLTREELGAAVRPILEADPLSAIVLIVANGTGAGSLFDITTNLSRAELADLLESALHYASTGLPAPTMVFQAGTAP